MLRDETSVVDERWGTKEPIVKAKACVDDRNDYEGLWTTCRVGLLAGDNVW